MPLTRLTRAGNTQPGIAAAIDAIADAVEAPGTQAITGDLTTTGHIVTGSYMQSGGAILAAAYLSGSYMAVTQSATAPATVTGGTIAATTGISRVAPASDITGVIVAAGSQNGQILTIRNESAFTITFDVAGTSRVADGTTSPIPALCGRRFTWSGTLWYRSA